MERVGEHPVPGGPLAVRWLAYEIEPPRAGAVGHARVSVENAGLVAWQSRGDEGIQLSYHWLDELGNAIVWDGIRTPLPAPVAAGERTELTLHVRGPIPPGRYRLAFDVVDEFRLWFAEVGNERLELDVDVAPRVERALTARGGDAAALAAQEEPLVAESDAAVIAVLAEHVAAAPDWSRRVLDAHQEGYALVGGSVDGRGGLLGRAPRELEPWAPGPGRVPGFAHPLLCPSFVREAEPRWVEPVLGLPAALPPPDEPWIYDGRILLRVRPRSGRRSA